MARSVAYVAFFWLHPHGPVNFPGPFTQYCNEILHSSRTRPATLGARADGSHLDSIFRIQALRVFGHGFCLLLARDSIMVASRLWTAPRPLVCQLYQTYNNQQAKNDPFFYSRIFAFVSHQHYQSTRHPAPVIGLSKRRVLESSSSES